MVMNSSDRTVIFNFTWDLCAILYGIVPWGVGHVLTEEGDKAYTDLRSDLQDYWKNNEG